MKIEDSSPGVVKQTDEQNEPGFPDKIPEVESENLCRRFDGYLTGWFRNNVPCVLAAEFKRRFKKRTGYSWKHIDDVFPIFQRWSTNFKFKRQRFGRSTCIVITQRYRPLVLTTAEVRRRLVGAIRNHVAKSGSAHVDRKFLENFHRITGLPPEQIFYAWRTLRRIDGYRSRWRGRGNGINFHVQRGLISHPEIVSGISPPSGGKEMKTATALPSGLPNQSSSSLRSQQIGWIENRLRGSAPPSKTLRACSPPLGFSNGGPDPEPSSNRRSGENIAKPPRNDQACHRWKPVRQPLHVCDRWVSAARILRKANFLSFGPMQTMHAEFFRVRFGPMHARNFAEDALRAGFLDSEICAAYRVGLEETQAAAARDWHDYGGGDGMREPSQAVARGWLRLSSDERTDEMRWAAIFRGDAAPGLSAAHRAETRAADLRDGSATDAQSTPSEPRGEFRTIAPGLRVRTSPQEAQSSDCDEWQEKKRAAKTRPDPTPALLRAGFSEGRTLEKYLSARGITLADLFKRPRAEQQKFVREMHDWQKSSADSFNK